RSVEPLSVERYALSTAARPPARLPASPPACLPDRPRSRPIQ
ncbi:unnamed protein product, partial [Soboliphyme baturini]|uniref:GcrA cell cycle regulator n=1 Tax=Soboliphyme baturini TaxID=241478 RepID=A0A183J8Y8_9BILA